MYAKIIYFNIYRQYGLGQYNVKYDERSEMRTI